MSDIIYELEIAPEKDKNVVKELKLKTDLKAILSAWKKSLIEQQKQQELLQ